jgi:hypothetical protein
MSVLLIAVDDDISVQRLASGELEPHQHAWALLRAAAAECGRGGVQSESPASAQTRTVPSGTSGTGCTFHEVQSELPHRLADYPPAAQRFLKAARLETKRQAGKPLNDVIAG